MPTKPWRAESPVIAWVCLAVIFAVGVAVPARATPPQCLPNPGGYVCTSGVPTPYTYRPVICTGRLVATPQEAQSLFEAYKLPTVTQCPGYSYSIGWLNAPATAGGACGTGGLLAPAYDSNTGLELQNAMVADLEYDSPAPACNIHHGPHKVYAVSRTRSVTCPRGYIYVSPMCVLNHLDPTKNLGGQCPTCGNPISPGSGNKFQKETDYVGGGIYPLKFERFYNSFLRRGDFDFGLYGTGNLSTNLGNVAVIRMATGVGRAALGLPTGSAERLEGVFWANVGLEAIGGNWRHTYQRTIRLITTSPNQVTTAYVYREDGRVFLFNFDGVSSWIGHRDVSDRLIRLSGGGWEYTIAATHEVETYNSDGRLESIRSRGGETHTLSYDADNRLTAVTDDHGHILTLGYAHPAGDANGIYQIISVTDPAGGVYQYSYGANNTLTSVTYPGGATRGYQYNNATYKRALTEIIDENGSQFAHFEYDAEGHANISEHAGGAGRVSVTYNKTSEVRTAPATVTDSLGAARYYEFAAIWGVAKVTSIRKPLPGGGNSTETFAYDSFGNVVRRKDYKGNSTCFAYDTTRNLETARVEGFAPAVTACPSNLAAYTPASGTRQRKIVTAWHATFRLPTSITEANRTTSFTHDANGNVLTRTVTDTTVTPNVSRTWTYTYDSFGRVLTEDGPRTDVTDVTTYTYYTCTTGAQCGQVHTITNAAGHVMTYDAYNAHGQHTQMTDGNGLVTTLAYDLRQRMTNRCIGSALPSCGGGELTQLEYWATGLLKKVTSPDGSYLQYTYDNAHRLTQIQDGAGNKITYTLDNMGNRTAENTYDPSNALKRTHTRVYNSLNQLWKDVNAAGTSAVTTVFGYDSQGNQTTVAAPLSRSSTNAYDELNRLNQITDPNSGVTQFAYDANDNLASVTDPRSLVTSYTYTGFGDLKTQVSPDTGTTSNTFDSGGNLATSTDARGVVTSYSYDNLNRVASAAYTLGGVTDQTITYTYDGGTNQKGHLTGASDANHSLSWSYDTHGRVTGKGQTVGSITKSMGYGYNSSGQLASIVLPSGSTIQYGYNSNNQVTSVTLAGSPSVTILNNVTYDPFGPITGWDWGNGTASTSRTFDTDGKLTQLASSGQRTFGYDDAFRITAANDIADTSKSWTLGYDILDRLSSATQTGTTIGYTYDANGNRLSQSGTSASTYTVSGTSNQLSSTSGALARSYTYDAVGNTLTSGATVHTYNNANRMKTGKLVGNGDTTYVYNGLGQRVKKSGGAITSALYFVYDEAGHLAGEYDSTGTLLQETVWLGDIPVATLRPKSGGGVDVFYVHTDQLNSPRKVSRPSDNQLRWKWDPTPFGEGAPNENPASLGAFQFNLRFPGQQFDTETDLNYNYFRDYDPAVGRYVQSDPIGLRGGSFSTYAYVGGNPLGADDPRGLNARTWTRVLPIAGGAAAVDGPLPIGDIIGGALILGAIIYDACSEKTCAPCSPHLQGTIGYLGPHTDHDHFPVGRPHLNLFVVNQNPRTCKCFWNKSQPDVASPPPQPSWVDLNGGFPLLTP
jgi:RHS repeat-associated protein